MNRSPTNVLFGGAAPVAAPSEYKMEGQITQTNVDDVVEALENADNVILVCFYITNWGTTSRGIWYRSLDTAWPWRRRSMRYQKSRLSCGQRA